VVLSEDLEKLLALVEKDNNAQDGSETDDEEEENEKENDHEKEKEENDSDEEGEQKKGEKGSKRAVKLEKESLPKASKQINNRADSRPQGTPLRSSTKLPKSPARSNTTKKENSTGNDSSGDNSDS